MLRAAYGLIIALAFTMSASAQTNSTTYARDGVAVVQTVACWDDALVIVFDLRALTTDPKALTIQVDDPQPFLWYRWYNAEPIGSEMTRVGSWRPRFVGDVARIEYGGLVPCSASGVTLNSITERRWLPLVGR